MIETRKRTAPLGLRRGLCAIHVAILTPLSLMRGSTLDTFDHFPDHADKVFHFAAYAVLGVALCWALPIKDTPAYGVMAMIVTACAAYGVILEALQALLVAFERDCSVGDIVANTLGGVAGVTAWSYRKRLIQ